MSGTVNAANAAKKALGDPDIYIFDSQFTSLGLGYQIPEIAKKLYEEGMNKEDVIKEMPAMRDKMNIFFVVKDLFYLARLERIWRKNPAYTAGSGYCNTHWPKSIVHPLLYGAVNNSCIGKTQSSSLYLHKK